MVEESVKEDPMTKSLNEAIKDGTLIGTDFGDTSEELKGKLGEPGIIDELVEQKNEDVKPIPKMKDSHFLNLKGN